MAKDETITLKGEGGRITMRMSPKLATAAKSMRKGKGDVDADTVTQVLAAAYVEGRNDGAREMADALDGALASTRSQLAAARPGRPVPKDARSSAGKAGGASGRAAAKREGSAAGTKAAGSTKTKAAGSTKTKAAGSTKTKAAGSAKKASGSGAGKSKGSATAKKAKKA